MCATCHLLATSPSQVNLRMCDKGQVPNFHVEIGSPKRDHDFRDEIPNPQEQNAVPPLFGTYPCMTSFQRVFRAILGFYLAE